MNRDLPGLGCKTRSGFAGIMALVVILLLVLGLIGADYGYVYYLEECGDESPIECFNGSSETDTDKTETVIDEVNVESSVTATGSISKKGYTANVVLNIPSGGGVIIGSVSGDCSGNITGTYMGEDNGAISGKVHGSCTPFLVPVPATATFSGTVNQQNKTVPIYGEGSAMGFSGNGSITLSY